MRVLLADDHTQVRWALRTAIGEEPALTLVGEVTDAAALLDQVQALRPDLILLDWELEGGPAAGLLASLRELDVLVQVIVLSSRSESGTAALEAGADDFVSKANGPEQLLAALGRAARERDPAPLS